jgi:Arc/MetJ-type ribon-helix-helix transcriptional regulator
MSEEKDWAKFYREHKDDPEIWGEPEEGPPSARRGGLSVTITVRFSPEEASAIRGLAQELGISYSEVVRRAVRKLVHFRLVVAEGAQTEHEGWQDYSFSTGDTRTGTPALAGR